VIVVVVAGNVPATLQIAARFPLRPVAKPSLANHGGSTARRPTKDY